MLMRAKTLLTSMVAVFAVAACGKKEVAAPPPAPIVMAPPVEPPPMRATPKERPVYVYTGDRFRDPFAPAGATGGYTADAVFDPSKASVKGIIFGSGQRTAV